ncbi:disks large homolog 5 [Anabrus simplex]|uniref:disks large homolog 5 n=1 Tax=Anabrus simplex TaxID=316456 RepID=UPI0034DDA9E5
MASGASSLDSTGSNSPLSRNYNGSNSDRSLPSAATSPRDYDGLKQQCDKAMHELQMLRRQHSEAIRRCDHTMKELEYYRGQHLAAMNQLEAAAQESSTLRSKYSDLASEKQRMDREVQGLQKEVSELRCQQQDVIVSESGANDSLNQHYINTLRKYDAVKDEYDALRKRYDDLVSSHSSVVNKMELAQEEVNRIKKQCDEMAQERNAAIRERNGLKQQCTAAIRQWDIALRERNEYREALAKVQQQHEEAVKEINQAMAVRMKASKDLKRLTEERNAAMQEYSLIMSERDTVHKEMEKLSDDLAQAFEKNKTLEGQNKDLLEEKKTLSYQIETLRREIASALHDRDKALKECNDLREKFGGYTIKEEANREGFKSRMEFNTYNRERDNSRKDQTEVATSTRDMYGKSQKERMDNLDQANLELDRLRKQMDKLQAELQEALQEAEVSKRRRDWAFSERDKIVLERESIRTLCDRLRKERDRAVSDLAEALRDSDDIKKQRNEASKELKDLKEKMEAEQEKENRMQQFHAMGHNHSHDSAIDADMQEWETEILDIDLTGLTSVDDLGFELVGGRDDPQYPNDSGIYVSAVAKGSVAIGKLKVNDCISRVNNLDCSNVSKRMVIETLRSGGGVANMVVRRRRFGGRCLYTTQLQLNMNEHGLSLETGIYICKITPGSLAAKEGNLAVGDRVLSINSKTMDGLKTAKEAMAILDDPTDVLTITTLKGVNSPGNSNSSGQIGSSDDDRSYFNSSKPTKDPGIHHRHKMVNSSSQTEDVANSSHGEEMMGDRRYLAGAFSVGERAVYKVNTSTVEKGSNSRAWEMFREKIDMVRGRRHSKDRNRELLEEKKRHRNSSPNTFEQEQDDALAELDSVIESYHGNKAPPAEGNGVLKRSRRRGKEMEKNGGTWPKARHGPVIEHGTGTILHPRKHKERVPLSVLVSNPPKYPPELPHCCSGRGMVSSDRPPSRPVSIAHDRAASCSSAYKPPDPHFSKSGQLLCSQKSFTPTPFKDLLCEKGDERERERLHVLSPSDASIDFSVKSGNIGKEVMEYYVKKKSSKYPPSDSECNMSPVESLTPSLPVGDSHSRIRSQLYGTPSAHHSSLVRSLPHYPFTPFQLAHPHPHPHSESAATSLPTRYPSPTLLPSSQSGESIGLSDTRPYCFEPSYTPNSQACLHSHSPSVDLHYHKARAMLSAHSHPGYQGNDDISVGYPNYEEVGTFPRKKENQRIRIPSNPSVTSKVSTGSIERASERGSPMPTFHVEVLSPGHRENKRNSLPDYCFPQKPLPGELRRVHIDKSVEPLGIQISCLESGGVFVSTVSEHSLAAQVGLQVGDQLLEVCGINMRCATYQLAANVLRQCGNSITMLVQYSPDKYHELDGSVSSSSDDSPSRSGSPTPCNSPKMSHKQTPMQLDQMSPSSICSLRSAPQSAHGTLTRNQVAQAVSSLTRQNATVRSPEDPTKPPVREPRYLFIETRKCSNLGISLVGGNAVGIFVHSVQDDSVAYNSGLRTGDQILKYNNTDLQHATAEEAAYELAKPADKVTVLAQYSLERYNEIKDKPGDSFYIRALFDRDVGDSLQLRFRKDDILYVDNTMFNGVPGHWRAWFVDEDGHKQQCGIIPSKYKVEEELLLRRSLGDLEADARRGSTSARRSFFRRKKHQRSSSRDSKELASFSNINLGWYSDSGTLNEEVALCSYQRVERLDYPVFRPVLIMGPLADCVMEKLIQDFPDKFTRCIPEVMHCSQAMMEKGVTENIFVDYRKKGNYFECTTVTAVKEICDKNNHCILDISLTSVERLHRHQIYPIVLLIKFKSTKHIKEVKDTRYPMEKVSAKAAKEMYEHALKLELEYRHYISAVIPAGVNVAYMCTQVKAAVDQEQKKTLWVPCGSL